MAATPALAIAHSGAPSLQASLGFLFSCHLLFYIFLSFTNIKFRVLFLNHISAHIKFSSANTVYTVLVYCHGIGGCAGGKSC